MYKISLFCLLVFLSHNSFSQCTAAAGSSNASGCQCPPGGGTNCDLLPDISIARLPLTQTSNYTEYPQVCNPPCSGNDGRLRMGVSTPIIGYGPLETRGTSKYVCGTDTTDAGTVANIPSSCPGTGQPPKQLINQRIYHKSGNAMTTWDRAAGSMTYHPSHGHQHVDDWGIYTLRQSNGSPNPLNWPIIGTGSKLGFCLLDIASCNGNSGYCTDSSGSTLNSSNIVNYGLGGGNYSCSNTVQGISNGWMDTYSQSLDGMWIVIPPGVCNGTYYVVVQIDPYNYFLETNENNNVIAVPITLTQQATSGTAIISANKNPNICINDSIILSANAGTSYQWSNGSTLQSISVSNAGSYTVTVTGSCGTAVSAPFIVTTSGPNPPATNSGSVCNSGSATLTATGSGTINWYNSLTGGSLLGTGSAFNTPVVNTSTIYYTDATTTSGGQSLFCPPANNGIGGGGNYTGSQYLIFDVTSYCTLNTVKMYAAAAGSITVQLLNSSGSVLNSVTLNVPAGESTQILNFPLPPGGDYRLTRSGSFSLFRNNAGVSYPYSISGYVTIKNSSAGTGYYYFFYNWNITTPILTCTSLRTSATVTVNPKPDAIITPDGSTTFCSGSSVLLSANSGSGLTYQWRKNGSDINGETGINYVATGTGNYKVRVTSADGCTKMSPVKTVTVNPKPDATITPGGPTSFCAGGSVVLTANSGTGLTYKWRKDASTISGATNINYTTTTAGIYKVKVTDGNGCTKMSPGLVVSVPCRNHNNSAENINNFFSEIYPNPSSDNFTIKLYGLSDDKVLLNVYDITGREVEFSQRILSDDEVNISLLNPGIYTVLISNGEKTQTLKLVKTE